MWCNQILIRSWELLPFPASPTCHLLSLSLSLLSHFAFFFFFPTSHGGPTLPSSQLTTSLYGMDTSNPTQLLLWITISPPGEISSLQWKWEWIFFSRNEGELDLFPAKNIKIWINIMLLENFALLKFKVCNVPLIWSISLMCVYIYIYVDFGIYICIV